MSPITIHMLAVSTSNLIVTDPDKKSTENLQDHLHCGPSIQVRDELTTNDALRDPAVAQKSKEDYERDRTRPWSEGPCYSFAYQSLHTLSSQDESAALNKIVEQYLNTSASSFPSQKVQFDFIRRMVADPNEATAITYMGREQRHFDKATLSEKSATLCTENFITIVAMLAHPFSRVRVHIRSASPTEKPVIDFRYLSHPLDAEILARHMCSFERLIHHESLASHLQPGGKRLPASFPPKFETVEEVTKMLRQCASTNYHPAGTCAMMSEELGGVVDERLRVYGVKGLRVCDASVMPIIARGNILSSVYAVAEKGADIIKEDLRQ